MADTACSARLASLRQLLLAAGMPGMARDLHGIIVDVVRMEATLDELVRDAAEQAFLAEPLRASVRRERPLAAVLPFRRPVPVFLVGEEPR